MIYWRKRNIRHMKQQHTIRLSRKERAVLVDITRKGSRSVHVMRRSQVLLKKASGWTDEKIAESLGITKRTADNIRRRFEEGGLDRALYDAKRSGYPPKLDEKAEAHLVALACSEAPDGRDRWTLELLRKRMIGDGKVQAISTVALWKRLKSRGIKPWLEKNVVHSGRDAGIRRENGRGA